jgi:hypothetical protein
MATLKNTIINDTGYMGLPNGNTAQRPGSPAEGYSRVNTDTKYVEVYINGAWFSAMYVGYTVATGGTVTTSGDYKIHTFTSSSAFTVNSAPIGATAEVLMVGGGGAGGSYCGGGGGGEVIYSTSVNLISNAYSIVIGAGASPSSTGSSDIQTSGSPTTAFGETAKPGGGGLGSDYNGPRTLTSIIANGGGGGSRTAGYAGITGQNINYVFTRYGGYTGGAGQNGVNYPTGGGAGAGANGVSPLDPASSGGNGGSGVQINIDGNNYYWAGGGAGMIYYYNQSGTFGGNGGLGGGGGGWGDSGRFGSGGTGGINVGGTPSGFFGGNGGANTGGGGGACAGNGGPNNIGTNGGSGIVIVKYRYQ